jgi:CheY-like chemotaxis protein
MKATPVRRLRILVVEDTPFNQKLILRLLGRWGHEVSFAENGRQALEFLAKDLFDLVLMDAQVPEMGGLEATREIRKREQHTGRHIPIIAMAAYAMKGFRERCLESGMDAHVSKPISSDILFKTIQKILPDETRSTPAEVPEANTLLSLDKATLLDAFEQDWDFLTEIVQIFLSDTPPMLDTIKEALQKKDADTLRRTAHSLKGMLRNFQAEAVAQTAFQLEEIGRQRAFDNSDKAYEELEIQLDKIYKILSDILKEATC